MLIFLAPILPVIVAVIEVGFVAVARYKEITKPPASLLASKSIKYGVVGAVISLVITIAWMVWYEHTSGYSAGNGPIGWIFFYGPISFAIGQVVALVKWWSNAL